MGVSKSSGPLPFCPDAAIGSIKKSFTAQKSINVAKSEKVKDII